jgi:plastocyanin
MSAPVKVAAALATFLLSSLVTVIAVREGRGQQGGPTVHEVRIGAMRFEPAVIDARPGDTIVWINEDFLPHTATSKDGSWDSGEIAPGATWKLAVSADPNGDYLCTFHPMMTGTIRDTAGPEAP